MSTLTARIPKQRRRLAWFVWLLGLPLTIFAILIGVVCFRELQAARHVEAELTRLRAVGQPVDNVTMAKWFERRTSPEGTAAWDEVLYLASSPVIQDLSGDLPIVGQGKRLTNLIPGSDWPAEKDVADYLQRVKPVLDLTHAATKFPTPVWFPLQFDGFSTLLEQWQNSRSVVRMLALDAEHACYQGESTRALRDIQSIEGTAKAFDSQAFMVGDLVCMAIRYQEFSAIQRSLRASIWDADQLAALRELVIRAHRDQRTFQQFDGLRTSNGIFCGFQGSAVARSGCHGLELSNLARTIGQATCYRALRQYARFFRRIC